MIENYSPGSHRSAAFGYRNLDTALDFGERASDTICNHFPNAYGVNFWCIDGSSSLLAGFTITHLPCEWSPQVCCFPKFFWDRHKMGDTPPKKDWFDGWRVGDRPNVFVDDFICSGYALGAVNRMLVETFGKSLDLVISIRKSGQFDPSPYTETEFVTYLENYLDDDDYA